MHVERYFERLQKEKSLERDLITLANDRYESNFSGYMCFRKVIHLMGKIHYLYSECLVLIGTDELGTYRRSLRSIDKICWFIARKRKRVFFKAALILLQEHPALEHSRHFSEQKFIQLCIGRIIDDPPLLQKWNELSGVITSLIQRLRLLCMTIRCYNTLVNVSSDYDDDLNTLKSLEKRNQSVVTTVRRVGSE